MTQCTLNFKNFNRTSGEKTCETKVVGHTIVGLLAYKIY